MNDASNSIPAIIASSQALEGLLALGIPIISIIMGVGAIMMKLWLDYRRKHEMFQLHHAERMAAIEKGIDVPPLPPDLFQERKRHTPGIYLYQGLVWLLVGISIVIGIYTSSHRIEGAVWGLLPTAVGVANLLYYFLAARQSPPSGT